MSLNHIQFEEDVESMIVVVDLVYLTIIHPISRFTDHNTREE